MQQIILIGFMGSGKTYIGKQLAVKLNRTFLDTDEQIEVQQGRSISTIFESEGEAYFRSLERTYLKELEAAEEVCVISTGGGLPVPESNRSTLTQLGTVIYLAVSPETVYQRISNDTSRPLLQCEDPGQRIAELMQQRRAAYEEAATVKVVCDGKTAEQIIEEICAYL